MLIKPVVYESGMDVRASKTGDGHKIQEHDSENMTVRIGTEGTAF
jgi:hypothetical protein